MLIVDLTSARIAEDVVSFGDLLELGFGFFLARGVLVGMVLHGETPVRLLEIIVVSVFAHLQDIVVINTH